MKESYDFKEVEPRVALAWDKGGFFAPRGASRKTFSMYVIPPNASGPLHVGNALMIAIQDVLARHHRAKGEPTLWVPGTDHGGYETQVTFERELESRGESKDAFTNKELYGAIEKFVERNNEEIVGQIKAMGASVDWGHFRYTLDEPSLQFVERMFRKMMDDRLIYRNSYMVNYCTSCATVLADIELKEQEGAAPLYMVKFPFENKEGALTLATNRPEFLYAVTHVLVHPQDARYAQHIGERLRNPSNGEAVEVVASKRKFDPKNPEPFLWAFSPSHKKYDFEYAMRNKIPSYNLLDWEGRMLERYPGDSPEEARPKEVAYLEAQGAIESVEAGYQDTALICKKGHAVRSLIRMTWFVRLDDESAPLREPALGAIKKESLIIYPRWREKGLVEWIGKMHDWPIARQNAWGIRIPIWYELSDPSLFTVWFVNSSGTRRFGNLKTFLDAGISLQEILAGLERVYAAQGAPWALEQEAGKDYLPETDTFDTWFSSGAWSAMVFDAQSAAGVERFYPSDVVVIGYDLLRLSIAREIMLGVYLTGRLPFKRVYFHNLLKSKDGQKMSKSLGNAVTLDSYLERYGADATRMGLLSYTSEKGDFYFADERLDSFKQFSERLWQMGRVCHIGNEHGVQTYDPLRLTQEDKQLLNDTSSLVRTVGVDIEKYFLAQAQEKAVVFLARFEERFLAIEERSDTVQAVGVFKAAFKDYLALLHPFMPFMTEELQKLIYKK